MNRTAILWGLGCLAVLLAVSFLSLSGQGLTGFSPGLDQPPGVPVPLRPSEPDRTAPRYTRYPEDRLLTWDEVHKEIRPGKSAKVALTHFSVTNNTRLPITITQIRPSCGCTLAKSPPLPWKLLPGDHDKVDLEIGIEGKYGKLRKSVKVYSTAGIKTLSFEVFLPERKQMSSSERMANIRLAARDRQVVFRGKCKTCHYDPAVDRKGEELYQAACAICHESPHRASMVPYLAAYKKGVVKDENYWRLWITHGKAGTLMPAFHKGQGGPLDEEQIEDLVSWLVVRFPGPPPGLEGGQ